MTPTFVSWCSGIGCFDLGLERAGWRRVGACERDPHARAIYARRLGAPTFFPEDLLDVQAQDVPEADLWVGGLPCQDLSVAGKRAGIHGERSGLIWTWLRLASERRPRFLLYENVPGLLSGRVADGDVERDDLGVPAAEPAWFGALLGGLADAGYAHASWRVLDAQHFGVPQRRRRVFLLACRDPRDGPLAEQVLLESEGVRGRSAPRRAAGKRVAAGARGGLAGLGEQRVARALGGVGGGLDPADLERSGALVVSSVTSKWSKGTGGPSGGREIGPHGALDGKDLVAFNRAQVTSRENCSRLAPGDAAPTLSGTDVAHVAFLDAYSTRGSCSPNQAPCKLDGLSDALDTTGLGAVFALRPDAVREGVAKTPSADAEGRVRLRDPGLGLSRDLAPTLDAGTAPAVFAVTPERGQGADLRAARIDVAPALDATSEAGSTDRGARVVTRPAVRRLTPLECERLQRLPDGFTCTCGARDEYREILREVYEEARAARLPERSCRSAVLHGAEAMVQHLVRAEGAGGTGGMPSCIWEEARTQVVPDARALVQRLQEDERRGSVGSSPQGREHLEQRSIEHRDSLCVVPHEEALVGAGVRGAREQANDRASRPEYWEDCRLPGLTAGCRCPDRPRYRALGNGGAVPVLAWIGRRLREDI